MFFPLISSFSAFSQLEGTVVLIVSNILENLQYGWRYLSKK